MATVPLSEAIASQRANTGVETFIASWDELAAVPTIEVAIPAVKIWVDRETGTRRVTRLVASSAATDRANGIQRPNDFQAEIPRCWLQAG